MKRWKISKRTLFIFCSAVILLLGFQNCSGGFEVVGAKFPDGFPQTSLQIAQCSFDGQPVREGASVTAYVNSTVAFGSVCESEDRICHDGSLSGSNAYSKCEPGAPASCLFNGQTIPHDGSVKAFTSSSVPFGQTCASTDRVCSNGMLSGTASFASCQVGAPSSCLFNDQTIAHMQTVKAFQTSTVPFGQTCATQDRVCSNGMLSGTASFASCQVGAPASCLFNGQTIAHTQTVKAFQTSTVPFGQTCAMQDRACTNGSLSGDFAFPACEVGAPAACMFGDRMIAHGESVMAYPSATVPFGNTCTAEARSCANGTLSGTNSSPTCSTASLQYSDLTVGTWTIPCQAGNGYMSYQSRFIAGEVEVRWKGWDSTCSVIQYEDYQRLKISELVTIPDATGTTFTWRYDRLEDGEKPMIAPYTDYFNRNATCGKTGYVTGVYNQNIPGTCGMAVQYWRVRLEKTGNEQRLYPPNTNTGNGATEATRPADIDRSPGSTRSLQIGNTEPNPQASGSLRP